MSAAVLEIVHSRDLRSDSLLDPYLKRKDAVESPQQHLLKDVEPVDYIDALSTLRLVVMEKTIDSWKVKYMQSIQQIH